MRRQRCLVNGRRIAAANLHPSLHFTFGVTWRFRIWMRVGIEQASGSSPQRFDAREKPCLVFAIRHDYRAHLSASGLPCPCLEGRRQLLRAIIVSVEYDEYPHTILAQRRDPHGRLQVVLLHELRAPPAMRSTDLEPPRLRFVPK